MKLEEVNKRTKEAVDFLVAALESGHSKVLTAYLERSCSSQTGSPMRPTLPDFIDGVRLPASLNGEKKSVFILAPMCGRRSTKDVATDEADQDA